MAISSSLVFAGIAPHPPIMVPEVGREAIADVRASIDAMADLSERVIASGAQTVVLISPHAPLDSDTFVAYEGPKLNGDFSMFRAPTATVQAELDNELLSEITKSAAEEHLVTLRINGFDLDHGTAVPLYFLQHNGWDGRVVALGYSFLANEDHLRFGARVRNAVDKVGRPVAFIASGDLSHRLKPGAPAGYNPDAHLFDEEVVDAIRTSDTNRIINMDQELRRTAGECGYRSILVALGVSERGETACEVINYEAPFGVGYLVAQLVSLAKTSASFSEAGASVRSASPTASIESALMAGAELPALARQVIETYVKECKIIDTPQNLSELLSQRAGCFVSIKTDTGDLRGCIGTFEPAKDTLAEELIANAISAATRDPRFRPITEDELPGLVYSVDVLSTPEPATIDELDPHAFGVIVEDQNGTHRGLLLPNLEGIETVAKQLEIASRKAGLRPGSPVKLWRFHTERYAE